MLKYRKCHAIVRYKNEIYEIPDAAAPQTTPQINGGQVTGLVS